MVRFTFLAVVLTQALAGADSADVCERAVPPSLKRALKVQFPGFRPPRLRDQVEGGKGCATVAVGDFDGDGQRDVAILLTNEKAGDLRLLVALGRGASWTFYRLPTWCGSIGTCYVETVKPGLYRRAEALDEPLTSPDERDQLSSLTDAVLSGTSEATGIVYVYSGGMWRYVWVSD